MRIRTALALSLCLTLAPVAAADEPSYEQAAQHLQEQEWAEAEAALEALVEAQPENATYWYELGFARHAQEDWRQAIAAWKQAKKHGFHPPLAEYNLACAHARQGKADKAFAHLDAAIDAGFGNSEHMARDGDLAALHDDPRWEQAVQRADVVGNPCAHDEHMAQFDFWLGTWRVTNPAGQQVGTNTIEKVQNGCIVREEWAGRNNVEGSSVNFYDPAAGAWVQVWRGDRGWIGHYRGGLDEQGRMVMTGQSVKMDGTSTLTRGTWTPHDDGTVEQHFEKSTDDGATWETTYRLTYTPMGDDGSTDSETQGR